MKDLFDQVEIGKLKIKNRFVRSATWEGLATPEGYCTSGIVNIMAELAKGQVGLLITGHAYINPAGQADYGQLGIYDNKLESSYYDMVKATHLENSKIILQITHGGCRAAEHITNLSTYGPSRIETKKNKYCSEVSLEEIEKLIEEFTESAVRASRIGFDGIQIHAAHGYLASQFLSPYFNHRNDKYGGNILNRTRFLLEIVNSIRSVLGRDYCITVKLNSEDYIENGFSIEDMLKASLLLEKETVDAIELSGGIEIEGSRFTPYRITSSYIEKPYYEEAAALFKNNLSIPLILVGGIRSFQTAQRLIRENKADLISFCRPLIREPDLVKKWLEGDREKSLCISCNKCMEPARRGEGIYCVLDKSEKKKE